MSTDNQIALLHDEHEEDAYPEVFDLEKIGKLTVVSGCPRSGTSLMMDCMRTAFGEERILGFKWPQERNHAKKRPNESDEVFETRQYLTKKMNPNADKDFEYAKAMNPNGFWEMAYTVQGIKWHLNMPYLGDKYCKIVSQGLVNSNPSFIGKVVYMLRNPRQVAKSQENLRRMTFVSVQEEQSLGKVHTPKMFINVTYQAALWILANPQVPLHIMNFDDLLSNPDEEFEKLANFLGEGDFSNHPIERKLNRSKPEEVENELWEYADTMYELMRKQDFKTVVDYYRENAVEINIGEMSTPCLRSGRRMAYAECVSCHGCKAPKQIENMAKQASQRGIDWQNEPCIFECLTNPKKEKDISMADSVRNNHWKKVLREQGIVLANGNGKETFR